ncbi:Sporulation initiation factor Spo0A C-terminal domain-containing protein, partial [Dysosmobacter welbionis]
NHWRSGPLRHTGWRPPPRSGCTTPASIGRRPSRRSRTGRSSFRPESPPIRRTWVPLRPPPAARRPWRGSRRPRHQ